MTMPQASARTKPSASISKEWQRPVGESMPCPDADAYSRGSSISMMPPASAISLSPSCRLRQAWWIATMLDEQAVSRVNDGPLRPSECEMRPEAMLNGLPVKA